MRYRPVVDPIRILQSLRYLSANRGWYIPTQINKAGMVIKRLHALVELDKTIDLHEDNLIHEITKSSQEIKREINRYKAVDRQIAGFWKYYYSLLKRKYGKEGI